MLLHQPKPSRRLGGVSFGVGVEPDPPGGRRPVPFSPFGSRKGKRTKALPTPSPPQRRSQSEKTEIPAFPTSNPNLSNTLLKNHPRAVLALAGASILSGDRQKQERAHDRPR